MSQGIKGGQGGQWGVQGVSGGQGGVQGVSGVKGDVFGVQGGQCRQSKQLRPRDCLMFTPCGQSDGMETT